MDENMTVAEVAAVLKCHPENVRRLCRRHVLHASRPGKRYYVDGQSVREYLARGVADGHLLAVRWLTLVPADRDALTVARLIRQTFGLEYEDISALLTRHGMRDVPAAVDRLKNAPTP